MRRFLLPAAALAAIGLLVSPAQALRIALPPQPSQVAVTAPVVVTGKVTAIEKETVDATLPYAGAKDKVTYKVAVVKIESGLAGAENLTHIKIGFVPPAAQPNPPVKPGIPGRPNIGRPGMIQQPDLKVDQQSLFLLAKHPSADFYVIVNNVQPVDITTDAGKKQLEEVKKVLAVVADPMKGLKSDKAETRLEAATLLVSKYRTHQPTVGETEEVAINADESKLILKTLAEAEWKAARGAPGATTPNVMSAFYQLGLTDKDGWKQPEFPRQPGQPVDFAAIQKEAFKKWLDGPGKDYTIKKLVAKKK